MRILIVLAFAAILSAQSSFPPGGGGGGGAATSLAPGATGTDLTLSANLAIGIAVPLTLSSFTPGYQALYLFTDGSGTTLTDSSANAYHCTLGAGGGIVPTWTTKGLQWTTTVTFPEYQDVSCPVAAINGAKTVQIWYNPDHQATWQPRRLLSTDTGWYISNHRNWESVFFVSPSTQAMYADRVIGNTSTTITVGNPALYYRDGELSVMQSPAAVADTSGGFTATTSFTIGNAIPGSFAGFAGTMYAIAIYPTVLTAQQIAQNEAAMESVLALRGVYLRPATDRSKSPVIFVGDSITDNYFNGSLQTSFPFYAMDQLALTTYVPINQGITGLPLQTMAANVALSVAPILPYYAGDTPIVVVQGGTNDVAAGTAAATIYGYEQSFCAAVHAYKPNAKCVYVSVIGRTSSSGAQETVRQTLNSSASSGLAAGTLSADALADVGQDPIMGFQSVGANTYYMGDGTHPTATGNQIMGNYTAFAVHAASGNGNKPFTLKVTVPRERMASTAATTAAVNLLQLGPRQKLCGVSVKHRSEFTGASVSAFTVSVGDSLGTATSYSSAFNIFQTPGNAAFQDTATWKSASYAGGVVQANFTSTGANVNAAITDLVIDATTNTKVTSATRTFTSADAGTDITITAGSGFTTGFYHINSVSAGAATLDRAVGTVGSTGGSLLVGEMDFDLCVVTIP